MWVDLAPPAGDDRGGVVRRELLHRHDARDPPTHPTGRAPGVDRSRRRQHRRRLYRRLSGRWQLLALERQLSDRRAHARELTRLHGGDRSDLLFFTPFLHGCRKLHSPRSSWSRCSESSISRARAGTGRCIVTTAHGTGDIRGGARVWSGGRLVTGVALSIAFFVRQSSRPHIALVGRIANRQFRNVRRHDIETFPQIAADPDRRKHLLRQRKPDREPAARIVQQPAGDPASAAGLQRGQPRSTSAASRCCTGSTDLCGDRPSLLHLSDVKGPVMDQLEATDFVAELTGDVFLPRTRRCGSSLSRANDRAPVAFRSLPGDARRPPRTLLRRAIE